MPAHEYQCNGCAVRFEKRQKMSDAEIQTCPGCGASVKRLISGGAGAISKGRSHSHHSPVTQPSCAMGGPCCGQSGGMCSGMPCES